MDSVVAMMAVLITRQPTSLTTGASRSGKPLGTAI